MRIRKHQFITHCPWHLLKTCFQVPNLLYLFLQKKIYSLVSEARPTASSCLLAGGNGFWFPQLSQPDQLDLDPESLQPVTSSWRRIIAKACPAISRLHKDPFSLKAKRVRLQVQYRTMALTSKQLI